MKNRSPVNLKLVAVLVIALTVLFIALSMTERKTIVDLTLPLITGDAIADAKTELMSDITLGNRYLGITLPPISFASPGNASDIEIIFKNMEPNPRCYLLGIELTGVDTRVSSAYFNRGSCLNPSCPGFAQIRQDAGEWFSINPNALPLYPQHIVFVPVSFSIPKSASVGGYTFTLYAHPADPLLPPGQCRQGLDKSHADTRSSPQTGSFQIEVRNRI